MEGKADKKRWNNQSVRFKMRETDKNTQEKKVRQKERE